MSVIQFVRAKNFKRIRVVEVDTAGKPVVTVGGRNGQGKSSLLDAIALALLGRGSMPSTPVRAGEDKAEIEIGMSDGIRITRRINVDGTGTIKIQTADGMAPSKPQEWLDARLAKLTCDPVRFLSLPAKEQAETLRRLAGIDTSILDAERAKLYAERTDVNRDAKRLQAAADSLTRHIGVPAQEVDIAALAATLDDIAKVQASRRDADRAVEEARRSHEAAIQAAEAGKTRADNAVTQYSADVENLERQLKAAKDALAQARDASAKWDAKIEAVKADTVAIVNAEAARDAIVIPDAEPIRAELAGANSVNAKVRANAEKDRAEAAASEAVKASDAITRKIESIDAQKVQALASASFPVDGLGIDETGTVPLFRGVPLEQASQAEKIRVAMSIALAGNPEIGVVLIRDASLLDSDSVAEVAKIAESRGAQVWLERVGDDDDDAVIIEDGTVRSD